MTIEQKIAEIYQFMKNEPDKYMPGETYVEHIDHFQSIITKLTEERDEFLKMFREKSKELRYCRKERLDYQSWVTESASKERTDLQSIIKNQAEEIKRLKRIAEIAIKALKEVDDHYMQYIENNIEVDTAATRMDNTAEEALAEIKKLEGYTV